MRILITNDDGIFAPGILALVAEVSKYHDVTIVAPIIEQSGVGHAFTFITPLSAKKVVIPGFEKVPSYAINGTPVDCVKLGSYNLLESPPDMVLSGINRGANLGSDVHYSGTASAALEGAIIGISSIAFSTASFHPLNYQTAASYALRFIDYVAQYPLPQHTMLNVNVPDLPSNEIRGIIATPLSFQLYEQRYEEFFDPRGEKHYWLPNAIYDYEPNTIDSDDKWVKEGFIAVTPIAVDMTNRNYLKEMSTHSFFEKM